MPRLLTVSSMLQCPHGGMVSISTTNTRARAGGAFLARSSDLFTIAGCPLNVAGAQQGGGGRDADRGERRALSGGGRRAAGSGVGQLYPGAGLGAVGGAAMERHDYAFPFRVDPTSHQGARTGYEAHVRQMVRQV